MKKFAFIFTLMTIYTSSVYAEETCVELNAPVISVADFDASGTVTGKDIAILAKTIRKNKHASRHNRRGEKSNHRSRHHRDSDDHKSRHHRRSHEQHETVYSAMFDRNADGVVDVIDLFKATRDMNKSSTAEDQNLARISNEVLEGTYSCVEPVAAEPVVPVEPVAPTAPTTAPASDCPYDPDYCLYIGWQ